MIACTLNPDTDTATATFTVSGPEFDGQQVGIAGSSFARNIVEGTAPTGALLGRVP